jgi:hypothetical protein
VRRISEVGLRILGYVTVLPNLHRRKRAPEDIRGLEVGWLLY